MSGPVIRASLSGLEIVQAEQLDASKVGGWEQFKETKKNCSENPF
jgi:hypothetical protein